MINELLNMNGYGLYVWSAFGFTLFSFGGLYIVTKIQYVKEQSKFVKKFGNLDTSKALLVSKFPNFFTNLDCSLTY